MKFAFVECQRRQHAVRTLCRALRVSPSGYYAARSRSPSARDQRQSSLTTKIRDVHLASHQTYGAPRVHAELSVQGIACCRNTGAKLMRIAQIVPTVALIKSRHSTISSMGSFVDKSNAAKSSQRFDH